MNNSIINIRVYLIIAFAIVLFYNKVYAEPIEINRNVNKTIDELNQLYRNTEFLKAKKIVDRLEIKIENEPNVTKYNFYTIKGLIHYRLDNVLISKESFSKALELSKILKDSVKLSSSYTSMGMILKKEGKFYEAFRNELRGLNIAEIKSNNYQISRVCHNIAHSLIEIKLYDMAEKFINKGLLYCNIETKHLNARFKLLQINICLLKNETDPVPNLLKECSNMLKNSPNKHTSDLLKISYGEYYRKVGKLTKAKKILTSALKEAKLKGEILNAAYVVIELAYVEIEMKNLAEAESLITPLSEIDNISDINLAYLDLMSSLSAAKKKYEKAIYYKKKYRIIEDSLDVEVHNKIVSTIKAANDFKMHILEYVNTIEKNEKSTNKKSYQYLLQIILIISLIIMAGIIAFYLIKRKSYMQLIKESRKESDTNQDIYNKISSSIRIPLGNIKRTIQKTENIEIREKVVSSELEKIKQFEEVVDSKSE